MASRRSAKHVVIYEQIAQAIACGDYAPGQKLPTESELVKAHKASRATLTRVMQRLVTEGLIERRPGAGTFVRHAASDHPRLFGLIIPGLGAKEFFEPICAQMAREAEEQHHTLLWGDATDQPSDRVGERAIELARRYVARKVAGVFFAPLEFVPGKDTANRAVVDLFDAAGIPVILLDRDIVRYPDRSRYDLVAIDHRLAACSLVTYLLNRGERSIEFVSRPGSAPSVTMRIAGYRDALREAGIEPPSKSIHFGDPTDEAFVRRVINGRFDRVFVCANDYTAARFMHTLHAIGVAVPKDVRVAGFDDVSYAHLLQVPLTTVRQPCRDLGVEAMRAMFDRLARPDVGPREIILGTSIIPRRSTDLKRSARRS